MLPSSEYSDPGDAMVAASRPVDGRSGLDQDPSPGDACAVASPSGANLPSASVVICAYTLNRWAMLEAAISSCLRQTAPPLELIVCVDHNHELFAQCEATAEKWRQGSTVPLVVVANRFEGRLGAARTTALEVARGDIVAFLDDDAAAEPDWLETLLGAFVEDGVVAVGGAPLPVFHTPKPRWFPDQFQWVFGCAYEGLPEKKAPLAHLIGANMAARRSALVAIGGFHSDNHDDMDMCHRLARAFPGQPVLYEPEAVVHHNVTPDRLTWRYFWRRCFFVNRGKVQAFRQMGDAANLNAEITFVVRSAKTVSMEALRRARKGDPDGIARLVAFAAGVALAGAGNISGRLWPERAKQRP